MAGAAPAQVRRGVPLRPALLRRAKKNGALVRGSPGSRGEAGFLTPGSDTPHLNQAAAHPSQQDGISSLTGYFSSAIQR
jgi:hypothetical protein